ncbi:uncharacterized protein LOC121418628 [Lytechinus variegatus]|uniref:uncharacterized protein LOC121418628 n=1 Tax=Lytechinus variegatus TaxID=7654 RepID=UPI001BB29E29|nr:uncharacterized protein LOC121418628 [Lytechinus variegatus]
MIYSAMVVVCLVVIWFVLGLMMWKMYCSSGKNARARRTQDQPVHSTASARTAVRYSPISGTITIDLPTGEDNPRPDGVKEEGASGQGESCSSGSNDGSHSSLSNFHSLKSNEEAERIRPHLNVSPKRDLSVILHRFSRPQTLRGIPVSYKIERVALRGRISSGGSCHSDLSGPQSLHSNDDPQERKQEERGITVYKDSSTMSEPKTLASTEDAV